MTHSLRRESIWLLMVAAGLAAIYLPGLSNPPVFDDDYLASGQLFSDYASPFHIRARMLSYASFVWLHALFGNGLWYQRLGNLAVHAGVVLSLYALWREVLRHVEPPKPEPGSTESQIPYAESPALALGVLFFALNPVAVYAVAYLIERSILMATLFVVLGLWAFVRALATRKPWLFAAAFACYVLAIMSKEHAILAPLAAMPLYVLVARPSGRRLAILSAGLVAVVAVAGGILAIRYGDILGKPFDEYSRVYLSQLAALNPGAENHAYAFSILNQSWLFFRYGFDWFVPYSGWMSISLRPPFPISWLSFPQTLGIFGYAAVIVGGSYLLLQYRDWRALVAISILLPAVLFATEFATVWVQDPFVLYRSYLWAIGVPGIVLLLAYGTPPRILLFVGAGIAALLVWQAGDRVASLATPERAWTDAIAKLPDDPRSVGRWFPYLNRGAAYVDRDQFRLAMNDFQASEALGDMGMGALNLGSLLSARGQQQQALTAFDRAEKQGYDLYNLPFQRGLALAALGKAQEAYDQFRVTILRNPPSPTRELALLQLGRLAIQLGKPQEAAPSLEQLVKSQPENKEARYLLGMAYIMKGEPAHAEELLSQLAARDTDNGRVYYARALANYGLKRKAEALADINRAIQLGMDNANTRDWQSRIKAMP